MPETVSFIVRDNITSHDMASRPVPADPDLVSKLFMAVEQSPSFVIIADSTGVIEYVNPKYTTVSGYSRDEVVGTHMRQSQTKYLPPEEIEHAYKLLNSGQEWQGEFFNKKKDGSYYWVSSHISPLVNAEGQITHFIDVEEDITGRKQVEEQLRASLKEKEVLLMEIHHRVKNNLQIVSSLLSLQSANISNERDMDVFRACQDQVRSMALIHEKMYMSRDLAVIEFGNYARSLSDYLVRTYNTGYRIRINVVAEQVFLDANYAVPCGLILNELITNSLKYAFPESHTGEITVVLRTEGDKVTMIVSDNGIGLPESVGSKKEKTMGISLVNDLVRQIDGTIEIDSVGGTSFKIQFINS